MTRKPFFSIKTILLLLLIGGGLAAGSVWMRNSFVHTQRDARASPVHLQLASLAASQGRFSVAVKESRQALAMDPDAAEAYRVLGYASYRLKRWKDSRAALEKAVQIKPDDAFATCFLGLTYAEHPRDADEEKKARDLLERSIQGGYRGAESWYGLGLIALRQDRSAEAVENLEKAVHTDPGWESGHYRLAEAYRVAGNHADAEREARIFERLKKSRPEFERLLGEVAKNMEDHPTRLRLVRLCLETQRYREAQGHLTTLARRAPSAEVTKGLAQVTKALEQEDTGTSPQAAPK